MEQRRATMHHRNCRERCYVRRLVQLSLGDALEAVPVANTVERVQGLTVDLVIFSLCSTDIEYASEVAAFLFLPNWLNVAVSRARTQVIVMACDQICNAIPNEYSGLLALNQFKNAPSLIKKPLRLNGNVPVDQSLL